MKCKSCKENIEENSNACIYCGSKINENSKNDSDNLNQIEFKETKNERSFRASFTDNTGENVSTAFASFISNKLYKTPKASRKRIESPATDEETDFEDIEFVDESTDNKEIETFEIFKETEGEFVLNEHRLKATSYKDFGRRIILLFIEERSKKGIKTNRKDLTKMLDKCSSNVGQVRTYITNNNEILKEGDNFSLSISGKESVKNIRRDIADHTLKNVFDISKGGSNQTKKSSKAKTYQVLDLNLTESKRKAFKKYFNSKAPKGQNDCTLVIMDWLTSNSKTSKFMVNEIYTGFNIVEKESPKSIESVLQNLKRDGKVNRTEKKTFEINHVGKDHVKYNLPKKQVK